MAIKVINISQLYGKDLFASPGRPVNIRRVPSLTGTILRQIAQGERIGTVETHAEGRDAAGNKDGSVWLQLKEKYGNPSGFGAWVKYMPDAFDWKSLKEQGAMTVEEQKAAEEEKNKTFGDKALSAVKTLGILWIASSFLKGN